MSSTELSLPPDELLVECELLAGDLAPELKAAPIYAVRVPQDYPSTLTTTAFTTRGAPDFAVRDDLIAQKRWRGPGTMVVFCKPLGRVSALGLMIHEIGHALPFMAPQAEVEPTPTMRKFQRMLIQIHLQRPAGDLPATSRWYPHHGLDFVRRCLHLHWRAWQAGHEIGLPEIGFAGPLYDLSPAWRYMHALGDEPGRMSAESFTEIASAKAPASFCKLWHHDFEEWCEQKKKQPPSEQENAENVCAA